MFSTHGDPRQPRRARSVPPPVDATVTYQDERGVGRIGRIRKILGDQAVIAPQDVTTGAVSPRTDTAAWTLCAVVAGESDGGSAR